MIRIAVTPMEAPINSPRSAALGSPRETGEAAQYSNTSKQQAEIMNSPNSTPSNT
jgi:hypothetical protein